MFRILFSGVSLFFRFLGTPDAYEFETLGIEPGDINK